LAIFLFCFSIWFYFS